VTRRLTTAPGSWAIASARTARPNARGKCYGRSCGSGIGTTKGNIPTFAPAAPGTEFAVCLGDTHCPNSVPGRERLRWNRLTHRGGSRRCMHAGSISRLMGRSSVRPGPMRPAIRRGGGSAIVSKPVPTRNTRVSTCVRHSDACASTRTGDLAPLCPSVVPCAVVCPHGVSSYAKYSISPPMHVAMPIATSDKALSVNFLELDFARLLAPLARRAASLLCQAAPAASRSGFVQPRRPRRRTS
jgi:hypothetical protein